MLVEFVRATTPNLYDTGEDDGLEQQADRMIAIDTASVAAVFESTEPGVVIVRLRERGGFKVRGTYAEVTAKLAGRPALAPLDIPPLTSN